MLMFCVATASATDTGETLDENGFADHSGDADADADSDSDPDSDADADSGGKPDDGCGGCESGASRGPGWLVSVALLFAAGARSSRIRLPGSDVGC